MPTEDANSAMQVSRWRFTFISSTDGLQTGNGGHLVFDTTQGMSPSVTLASRLSELANSQTAQCLRHSMAVGLAESINM